MRCNDCLQYWNRKYFDCDASAEQKYSHANVDCSYKRDLGRLSLALMLEGSADMLIGARRLLVTPVGFPEDRAPVVV